MVPKIASLRYLRSRPTAKAVKRPKLSLDSIARSLIKGYQHGIPLVAAHAAMLLVAGAKVRWPVQQPGPAYP